MDSTELTIELLESIIVMCRTEIEALKKSPEKNKQFSKGSISAYENVKDKMSQVITIFKTGHNEETLSLEENIKEVSHMRQCNDEKTSNKICDIFIAKLKQFKYIGERTWGNPAAAMSLETYEIHGKSGNMYCALVEWANASTGEPNRLGIISTLPNPNESDSLGQISEVTIPYEFSKRFNTRAYEENDVIEIRNYGKFTVGRGSLKRDDFFSFVRETGLVDIYYDEEQKPYIKVFKITKGKMSKEQFADSLIDFTLLVKKLKDRYR